MFTYTLLNSRKDLFYIFAKESAQANAYITKLVMVCDRSFQELGISLSITRF